MKSAVTAFEDKVVDHVIIWIAILSGAGQQAARMMISDAHKVAEGLQGPKRAEILQLCNEVENLTDQLNDLARKGMVSENICCWYLSKSCNWIISYFLI